MADETKRGGVFDATIDHEAAAIGELSHAAMLAELDALRAQVAALREQPRPALDFDTLQQVSVARCESLDGFNQKLDEWTLLEWAGAMCGEAGEAANVAKKLRRKRAQRGDDKATVELLGEELADTVSYAVLTAARAGIDLGEAIVAKFNKVSKDIGSTYALSGKTSQAVSPGDRLSAPARERLTKIRESLATGYTVHGERLQSEYPDAAADLETLLALVRV